MTDDRPRQPFLLALLIAPIAGVGAALGQAPWSAWWVAFPAIVWAFSLFQRTATPFRAAVIGWLVGLGYFGLALHWLMEPFQVDAETFGWMAPFALAGMSAGLSLFWAIAFWIAKRIGSLYTLVAIWALAELARGYLLTGFPWALVGHIWLDTLILQFASVVGAYGLTSLTFFLAAGVVDGWNRVGWDSLFRIVIPPALVLSAVAFMQPPSAGDQTDRPVVRLIQPNAAQSEKWQQEMIPVFFERQRAFTAEQPRPDLIIWPETALPMLLENAGEALGIITEAADGLPVVIGIQRREEGRFYNALAVLNEDGVVVDIYDKHHLVPFGEYMPLAPFFRHLGIAALAARADGGYARGTGPRVLDLGAVGLALPMICYEAVFPQHAFNLAERPDFQMQLTNDAWFGLNSGPYQHLAQARFRAVEQGLPLVRSANTGVSAVIDGYGRVLAMLPLNSAGYLDHPLPPVLAPTPYSQYGDTPIVIVLLLMVAFVRWRVRRKAP